MTTAAPIETPLTRLRDELTSARRQGLPFSAAWPSAVRIALSGHHMSGSSRSCWLAAIQETEDAWERAYYAQDEPAAWTTLPDLMSEYGPAPRQNQLLG